MAICQMPSLEIRFHIYRALNENKLYLDAVSFNHVTDYPNLHIELTSVSLLNYCNHLRV